MALALVLVDLAREGMGLLLLVCSAHVLCFAHWQSCLDFIDGLNSFICTFDLNSSGYIYHCYISSPDMKN